ncbi:hypothetical protein DPMN_048681, partial [Dreissena polymorpha]
SRAHRRITALKALNKYVENRPAFYKWQKEASNIQSQRLEAFSETAVYIVVTLGVWKRVQMQQTLPSSLSGKSDTESVLKHSNLYCRHYQVSPGLNKFPDTAARTVVTHG